MRAPSAEPFLAALLAFVALAPAAMSQEQDAGEDLSKSSETIVAADPSAWETLAGDLFVSGERGVADPGKVEPVARNFFKLGPVGILPRIDETLIYDDNIFLTDDDQEEGFILRTRAGALADWSFGGGQHRVSAGYDMIRSWYPGGESKNYVEQLASVQLDLGFDRLKFTIGDRYEDRTDPILAVFTAKIERRLNTVYGKTEWRDDAHYFEVKAENVGTAYDDDSFQQFDRDEGYAHVEVGWLEQQDLWFFVRAGALNRDFDQDQLNDGVGELASVGVRFSRDQSLEGVVRRGARYEQFDDDAMTDSDDDALNPDAEARVIWRATREDAVNASYVHTTEFLPVSNYEVLDRLELGWTRMLSDRLRGSTGFGIEHVNPSDVQDAFWRYVVGAGVRWRVLEFVDVTADWQIRIRSTDVPNGDYTGNQFSVGVAVRL